MSWATQRKPKKHFVASMTDAFGEFVPDEWVFEILDAMLAAPLQTFQVLTKRAERAYFVIREWLKVRELTELPANIWIGASIENEIWANDRIPYLAEIPAKIRFLSCEPLIGPIDLSPPGTLTNPSPEWIEKHRYYLKTDLDGTRYLPSSLGGIPIETYIHWVIIGGESGPNARPMSLDWARKIDFQCKQAGTPVFWKQLGMVQARDLGLKDPKGGDPDEWPFEGRREFPEAIPVTIPEPVQASLF